MVLFAQKQGGLACSPSSAVGLHNKSRGVVQTA